MSFEKYQLPKSLIWITIINYGYIDYTKNFLISMNKCNVKFKLIIYCIDDQSFNELQNYDNCIPIKVDFLNYNLPSEFKLWSNIDYKRICFAKLDAILYTLENTYQLGIESVGFIDTDIVLFSDPSDTIINMMNENKYINIFSQCDESPNKFCSNPYNCRNLCAGIIIFRNVKNLYRFLKYPENEIDQFINADQDFLQQIFSNFNVPHLTVPKHIFPNGSYYQNLRNNKIEFEKSNVLIHFNYMIGHEKKEAMKLQNLWYLE